MFRLVIFVIALFYLINYNGVNGQDPWEIEDSEHVVKPAYIHKTQEKKTTNNINIEQIESTAVNYYKKLLKFLIERAKFIPNSDSKLTGGIFFELSPTQLSFLRTQVSTDAIPSTVVYEKLNTILSNGIMSISRSDYINSIANEMFYDVFVWNNNSRDYVMALVVLIITSIIFYKLNVWRYFGFGRLLLIAFLIFAIYWEVKIAKEEINEMEAKEYEEAMRTCDSWFWTCKPFKENVVFQLKQFDPFRILSKMWSKIVTHFILGFQEPLDSIATQISNKFPVFVDRVVYVLVYIFLILFIFIVLLTLISSIIFNRSLTIGTFLFNVAFNDKEKLNNRSHGNNTDNYRMQNEPITNNENVNGYRPQVDCVSGENLEKLINVMTNAAMVPEKLGGASTKNKKHKKNTTMYITASNSDSDSTSLDVTLELMNPTKPVKRISKNMSNTSSKSKNIGDSSTSKSKMLHSQLASSNVRREMKKKKINSDESYSDTSDDHANENMYIPNISKDEESLKRVRQTLSEIENIGSGDHF